MKTAFILLSILFLAAFAFSQPTAVEKEFEANKAKYKREHLVLGEDATSGYDYLFYKSGKRIGKIRSIWSSSVVKELRIDDYYFQNELVVYRKLKGKKTQLKSLIAVRNSPLTTVELFEFMNSKLVKWIESGKAIPNTDPRWNEKEKEIREQAKLEAESYEMLKGLQ